MRTEPLERLRQSNDLWPHIDVVSCLCVFRSLQGEWRNVGLLEESAIGASGNPCVHGNYLVRSIQRQGENEGRLFRMRLGVTGESTHEEIPMPRTLVPGQLWSRRIYAFPYGDLLYIVAIPWSPGTPQRPMPQIFRANMRGWAGGEVPWRHVADFRSSRVLFGAILIGNKLVIVGGCANWGRNRPCLRKAEYITLDGPNEGSWTNLPDLPFPAKKIRLADYRDYICMVGVQSTQREAHDNQRTVLALDKAVLDLEPGRENQTLDGYHWLTDLIPPTPYRRSGLAVTDDDALVAAGGVRNGDGKDDVLSSEVFVLFQAWPNAYWVPITAMTCPREHARLIPSPYGLLCVGGRSPKRCLERLIIVLRIPRRSLRPPM